MYCRTAPGSDSVFPIKWQVKLDQHRGGLFLPFFLLYYSVLFSMRIDYCHTAFPVKHTRRRSFHYSTHPTRSLSLFSNSRSAYYSRLPIMNLFTNPNMNTLKHFITRANMVLQYSRDCSVGHFAYYRILHTLGGFNAPIKNAYLQHYN